MSSLNFYFKHKDDLCTVFCMFCKKIAYSTKENKYLKNQKCTGHDKLQCLNSSCLNGFSTTYQYHNSNTSSNERRKIRKENIYLISSVTLTNTDYMERFSLSS